MIFRMNLNGTILRKIYKIFLERFEYIYEELPNQITQKNNKNQIPNVVYQTWVSRKLPWRMSKEIKKFRELNYDHSFLLFTDKERDEYMQNSWGGRKIYEIYKNSVFKSSKTDIW